MFPVALKLAKLMPVICASSPINAEASCGVAGRAHTCNALPPTFGFAFIIVSLAVCRYTAAHAVNVVAAAVVWCTKKGKPGLVAAATSSCKHSVGWQVHCCIISNNRRISSPIHSSSPAAHTGA